MADIKPFKPNTGGTPVATQEITTTDYDNLTLEDFDVLTQQVKAQAIKDDLETKTERLKAGRAHMGEMVNITGDSLDDMTKKLARFKTVQELQSYLNKGDKNVEEFFIDENGESIKPSAKVDNERQEIEFKKGFLIYLKETEIAFEQIDAEYDKLDEYTSEFNKNMKDITMTLSDNILSYISALKDKMSKMTDEKKKIQLATSIYYIESGYNMAAFTDLLKKYPSIIDNCKTELKKAQESKNDTRFVAVGKKYLDKSKKYTSVNLIRLISDYEHGIRSFEEYVLVEGEQYDTTDLFVYSIIRYFAHADWSDKNVRALHASIALVLKKIMDNTLDVDVKIDVINSIVDYLKMFR